MEYNGVEVHFKNGKTINISVEYKNEICKVRSW